MLVASIAAESMPANAAIDDALAFVHSHENVCDELKGILEVLLGRISHATLPLVSRPDVPLEVYARYSRAEILAACGVCDGAKMPSWREGVRWVEATKADLLAFTLDKTSGAFSPTTRYRDYAISRELIHWESQSGLRSRAPTGQRYQHYVKQGSSIMLFARLNSDDRAFWFLGPATYVKHEGEQPMAITWQRTHPLPADLYTTFAAAVA
jgi:hypothetical protein